MRKHLILPTMLLMACLALFVQPKSQAQTIPPATQAAYLPLVSNFIPSPTPTFTDTPTATNTPLPTATPLATATPIPEGVFVKSSKSIAKSSSFLYVVGEIVNGFDHAVYSVSIQAAFYDNNNQLVATESGYTMLMMTAAHGVNPFRIILSNPPASIVRYELVATNGGNSFLDYRPITVLSQAVRDNFGAEAFGQIRNENSRLVRSPAVAVTFYDANGKVVYADYSYADGGDLSTGQTATYSIKTFQQIGYASYQVQAQSYFPP